MVLSAAPPRGASDRRDGRLFSGDGQRLAAVDKSGEIRIWDTASASGRPLRVLPAPAVMAPAGINAVWYSAARWVMSDTAERAARSSASGT